MTLLQKEFQETTGIDSNYFLMMIVKFLKAQDEVSRNTTSLTLMIDANGVVRGKLRMHGTNDIVIERVVKP